jgi:hypothetical protein
MDFLPAYWAAFGSPSQALSNASGLEKIGPEMSEKRAKRSDMFELFSFFFFSTTVINFANSCNHNVPAYAT